MSFVLGAYTSQFLDFPFPLLFAPLIFSTLPFCYATVKTGWAQNCLGSLINGSGGRSKAREGRIRNEEASLYAALLSLGSGVIYQELF